ncbi:MAG: hypothetical protein VKJ02_13190 [Snowella sp.]|nr:hypothetical protein [Snowella sp.]
MGFRSLSLSLLSILLLGNLAHANESEITSSVPNTLNNGNPTAESSTSSSIIPDSQHVDKLDQQDKLSSQAKLASLSASSPLTVLHSIYVRDNTLWVYNSGNDAKVLMDTQKELGKVHLTLNETLLDQQFRVYQDSTATDSSLKNVQVNQVTDQPAVIEIVIETDQQNWQILPRQGGFRLTQADIPKAAKHQLLSQNPSISTESSSSHEPLLASSTITGQDTTSATPATTDVTQTSGENAQTIGSVVTDVADNSVKIEDSKTSALVKSVASNLTASPIKFAQQQSSTLAPTPHSVESSLPVQASSPELAQAMNEASIPVVPENAVENSSENSPLTPLSPESSESTPQSTEENSPPTQPIVETVAPEIETPLYRQPIRLLHLNTANQLKAGDSIASFSETQTLGGQGTGNQTYYTYSDWGLTDDLQVGWAWMLNDDPTYNQVNGEFIEQQYQAMGPNIKYRFYQDENWSLGILGALEHFQIYSGPGLYNNQESPTISNTIAGSIQVPISYNFSEELQATITPGVNIFSNNLNGVPFFGTIFNVGAGLSWQILPEFSVYANTVVPFGSGNNAVSPSREFFQKVLWSAGGTYAFNKAIAIELHVTNSFGGTPTTGILTLPTASNEILLGGSFIIVPSAKEKREDIILSDRNQKLLFDWFTLTTPYILPMDDFGFRVAGDSEGSIGGRFFYSFLQDYQFEVAIASIGGFDTSTVIETRLGTDTQWRAGGKLVLLNQLDGDPFSITGRLTFGREWGNKQGYMMVEFPMMYEINPQWAVLFSPKAAISGGNTPVGIGLGANYQLNSFTQLIAEVTPLVTGERTVWSAGVRFFPIPNLSIDLVGTNSTSQFDLGTVVAEPGTRFSAGVQWRN